MTRYIDADKFLQDEIKRCGCVPLVGSCTTNEESLAYQLAKAPTADVVEVKHGEWIDKNQEYGDISCSECGAIERPGDSNYRTPKCPLCGAKMDGGGSDDCK